MNLNAYIDCVSHKLKFKTTFCKWTLLYPALFFSREAAFITLSVGCWQGMGVSLLSQRWQWPWQLKNVYCRVRKVHFRYITKHTQTISQLYKAHSSHNASLLAKRTGSHSLYSPMFTYNIIFARRLRSQVTVKSVKFDQVSQIFVCKIKIFLMEKLNGNLVAPTPMLYSGWDSGYFWLVWIAAVPI